MLNQFSLPRRSLQLLAGVLDRRSKGTPGKRFSHALYRLSLPDSFKQLGVAGPRFFIPPEDSTNQTRQILWDGRSVGKIHPLANLRNSCSGHCFLVATGPSLKQVDLSRLKGHPTFGVNGAILKFKEAGFNPTHYTIADEDFFENRFPMVREAIESGSQCFFPFVGLSRICEFAPELLARTDFYLMEMMNRHFDRPRLSPDEFRKWVANDDDMVLPAHSQLKPGQIGFSRNAVKGIFPSRTVLYCALQLAYHLGYRCLFILGMDLDYAGPDARFYERSNQMRPTNIPKNYEQHILPAFQLIHELCVREKLKVFNLSPVSRLPESVIPRLTLDEALDLITTNPPTDR